MLFTDKISAFWEKFFKAARVLISSGFLAMIAIAMLMMDGSSLNHPHWCRFFCIVFLVLLWLFINRKELGELPGRIRGSLLNMVPALGSESPLRFLLAAVYIVPGFLILGHYVLTIVAILKSGAYSELEPLVYEALETMPIIGEFRNMDFWDRLWADLPGFYSGIVTLSADILFLHIIILLVSAVARLLVGAISGNRFLRILAGFSALVYTLSLPGMVNALIEGSFLDFGDVGQLFFLLDSLNGLFLILGYMVLVAAAVFLVHSFFIPFILFFGSICACCIPLGLLTLLSPDLTEKVLESRAFSTLLVIVLSVLLLVSWLCGFGKDIWELSPSDG